MDQMASWVTETNYPLVSELHQANFRKLGSMGKLLVVGVVDPSDTTRTSIFLNGLREVGRSQRDLVAQHYVLGYLDGVRWKGFVRQFTIGDDLPRLFVLDMPKGSFYVDPEVSKKWWEGQTRRIPNIIEGNAVPLTNNRWTKWMKLR